MRYEQLQSKREVELKRLCGGKRHPFKLMAEALQAAVATATKRQPGRPKALSLAGQLLMTLRYWRQSGRLLPLGAAGGVSEGTASRCVRWVANVLVKAGRFALPKRRRRLALPPGKGKVVALEATQSPVQRPKKHSAMTTAASASVTP